MPERMAGTVPPADRREPGLVEYQQAIGPVVARLEEMGPFLISASTTPTPDVMDSLTGLLTGVRQLLSGIEVPSAVRPAHTLLVSAVVLARRAVAADFSGDRLAQAHQALAMLEAAKEQLPKRPEPTSGP
jgi:hypothetical protein